MAIDATTKTAGKRLRPLDHYLDRLRPPGEKPDQSAAVAAFLDRLAKKGG